MTNHDDARRRIEQAKDILREFMNDETPEEMIQPEAEVVAAQIRAEVSGLTHDDLLTASSEIRIEQAKSIMRQWALQQDPAPIPDVSDRLREIFDGVMLATELVKDVPGITTDEIQIAVAEMRKAAN